MQREQGILRRIWKRMRKTDTPPNATPQQMQSHQLAVATEQRRTALVLFANGTFLREPAAVRARLYAAIAACPGGMGRLAPLVMDANATELACLWLGVLCAVPQQTTWMRMTRNRMAMGAWDAPRTLTKQRWLTHCQQIGIVQHRMAWRNDAEYTGLLDPPTPARRAGVGEDACRTPVLGWTQRMILHGLDCESLLVRDWESYIRAFRMDPVDLHVLRQCSPIDESTGPSGLWYSMSRADRFAWAFHDAEGNPL